jgi:dihydropteroate synthase
VSDVLRDLEKAKAQAVERGVRPDRVWFDPGLGFSKNARHSIELVARCRELVDHGAVLVYGTSRKSFIRVLHDTPPEERLGGTIAASLWAARAGVQILRVHDVAAHRQALLVEAALAEASGGDPKARVRAAR